MNNIYCLKSDDGLAISDNEFILWQMYYYITLDLLVPEDIEGNEREIAEQVYGQLLLKK